jgi:hypothetical protein
VNDSRPFSVADAILRIVDRDVIADPDVISIELEDPPWVTDQFLNVVKERLRREGKIEYIATGHMFNYYFIVRPAYAANMALLGLISPDYNSFNDAAMTLGGIRETVLADSQYGDLNLEL